MKRLLAKLLAIANADPAIFYKEEFYRLKFKLLEKHGTIQGTVLQHIKQDCWGCDGTGIVEEENCPDCRGTGIFRQTWWTLTKWDFCGHAFLTPRVEFETHPIDGLTQQPAKIDIEGKVKHTPSPLSNEAALWLFLLYDRPVFFRLMTEGFRERYLSLMMPLSILQASIVEGKMLKHKIKSRWHKIFPAKLTDIPF